MPMGRTLSSAATSKVRDASMTSRDSANSTASLVREQSLKPVRESKLSFAPGAVRASNMSHAFGSKMSAHAVFQRNMQLAEHRKSLAAPIMYDDEFTAAFLDQIDQDVDEDASFKTRLRAWLAHIILHQRFETMIGVVILSNFMIIALETDARARRDNAAQGSSERNFAETMLEVITVTHLVYLVAYTLECVVRLYVLRMEFFKHRWNIFDLVIVVTGILAEIVSIWEQHSSGFEGLDGLRTIRTIRLLRATRVLVAFDELYSLISGLTHAIKALMWAGLLMLMVLTVWSIIAVEYVKPLMADIASRNGFGTCSWCPTAFDNVFLSNLTFFQIISGDGWSHVGRPLIEEHAWTVILFVAVIFSMVFGLLNLIVAVIVDSAVQAREADIMTMAARKDATRAAAWDCFHDMVGELDKDGDGVISVDELREGLIGDDELGRLGAYLTTMGIEMTDLDMVFELLDADGDGAVTHDEFTHQLYQMKTQELPITLCYVRSGVTHLQRELEQTSKDIQKKLDHMLRSNSIKEVVAGNHVMPPAVTHVAPPPMPHISNHEAPEKTQATPNHSKRASIFQHSMDKNEADTKGPAHARRGSLFVGKPPPTLRMPNCQKTARASVSHGTRAAEQTPHHAKNASSDSLKSDEGAGEFAGVYDAKSDNRLHSLPDFSMEEHEDEGEQSHILNGQSLA